MELADENCWEDNTLSFTTSKLSLVEVAAVVSVVDLLRLGMDPLAALDPLPLEDWRWSNWSDSSPDKQFSDKVSWDSLPSCLVGTGELMSSPEGCDDGR